MDNKNRRVRKTEEPEEGASWMTTYSDLVTLLLTFFVMLFSMATIDAQKFEQIAYSLRTAFQSNAAGDEFNVNSGKDLVKLFEENTAIDVEDSEYNNEPTAMKGEQEVIDTARRVEAQKLEKVIEELEEEISRHNLGNFVKVIEEKHMVILRIDSVILFDLGKADIKTSGRDILEKLGNMLNELDNDIVVQGHTDNLPIDTFLFPSNWELSTKRATNVVRFLIETCDLDPSKLTATGNAEFRPIRPNDTEENRQKNRRIDIVIDKKY
ncbi:MAG: flagellar motor protein MotB [Acetivibrionales bacterium]|jgi:chemotaxis protein MotB